MTFVEKQWQDIKVGDIVKILKDQFFPADLLLLGAMNKIEGKEGVTRASECYVQTKNLDGETNLKSKPTLFQISN